jgi:hypothetical protein
MRGRRRGPRVVVSLALLLLASVLVMPMRSLAQAQQGANTQTRANTPGETNSPHPSGAQDPGSQSSPLYRVTVVARTTKAINYSHVQPCEGIDADRFQRHRFDAVCQGRGEG